MVVNETSIVGVGINTEGEFRPIVGHKTVMSNFSVFLDDSPYGVTELFGFSEVEMEAIDEETVTDYQSMLLDNDFGRFKGIIKIEDGILLIEDFFTGKCGIIKGSLDIAKFEELKENPESGEADSDTCEYFEDVMSLF
ncbi:MAG: hypothetical protein IJE43_19145 [Alphaproteobacteria bacterium]|nr:hypothetical protein [Alphaproteobacteria bacterium]